MHRWGGPSTAACECGAKEPAYPIYYYSNGACILSAFDDSLVPWMTDTCSAIQLTVFFAMHFPHMKNKKKCHYNFLLNPPKN